jgi:hypothetical protein
VAYLASDDLQGRHIASEGFMLEEYVAPTAEADSANADENTEKSSERGAPDLEKTETDGVVESASDPAKPPPRRITGVVVGPDGKPVAGAGVCLFVEATSHPVFSKPLYSTLPFAARAEDWGRRHALDTLGRARTDAAGRFAMQPEPSRMESYMPPHLMVRAKGLGLACSVWDQTAGDVEIRLPREVPIRGRLVTPDGRPAEGVTVRVAELIERPTDDLKVCQCSFDGDHLAKRYLPEFWPPPARTNGEGSFALAGIPAGALVFLHLLHPDFAPEWIDVDTRLRPGEETRVSAPDTFPPTFTLQLKPPRPVEGVATAADTGNPLAGVLVEVRPGPRHSVGGSHFGQTDEKGRYRFHCRLARRYYSFSIFPAPESGYLAARANHWGWPEGAETLVKDFSLDRGKLIRGRVLDAETGKPIAAAGVVYRPSKDSPHRYGENVSTLFRHPALTDDDGRFTLTGLSGPGLLLVETPDPSYVRSPDPGALPVAPLFAERAMPLGLTPIDVPSAGTLEQEVVIRLRRGRKVTLQAVGPRGEKLPWVRAAWEGIDAEFGGISNWGHHFPDGRVVLPGLDPSRTTRVFLTHTARKLGAVFDVTPETADGPVEVRLQPTATVVGQAVTQAGKPAEYGSVTVLLRFDPSTSEFSKDRCVRITKDRGVRVLCGLYVSLSVEHAQERWPRPAGRFTLDYIIPGATFGLAYCQAGKGPLEWNITTIKPLKPGERRDVGKLVIPQEPRPEAKSARSPSRQPKPGSNPLKLLELAMRIGIVPDLSKAREDRPPKIFVLPGSPAEKAGIRSGDRVTGINGQPLKGIEDMLVVWSQMELAKGLRLSLLRDEKPVEVKLTSELLSNLFGPKMKPLGEDLFEVTFSYQPKKPAEAVYLAGSFNDWKPTAHKMDGPDQQGRYTTRLKLKKGRYEYKFVLDGQTWQTDPENVLQTGFYRNSVFHVGAER